VFPTSQHFENGVEKQKLAGQLKFVMPYIPAADIITRFAQECRHQKMLSQGNNFELFDVVTFVADFDILFESLCNEREWYSEVAELIICKRFK
jgi:hypothetical protein